jgi:hypothetical protein
MDIVLMGALIFTFVMLIGVFALAFRHMAELDRERHVKYLKH